VLDLAAGHGRHARLFASRGARVLAVDRDREALESVRGVPGIDVRVADLETGAWPLDGERFDAIVVVNYLHRALFAPILDALRDDGALLYETFAVGNERCRAAPKGEFRPPGGSAAACAASVGESYERCGRPSNPDFLLRRDELLERVRGRLTVVAFEQGEVRGDRPAVVQRLAAVGAARSWPPALP